MQINISGQHLEVTDALKAYIHNKLERIQRHYDHVTNAQVTLTVNKNRQYAEMIMNIPGSQIHADSEHDDLYAAIDLLTDKIDRQLLKHKEKGIARQHGS